VPAGTYDLSGQLTVSGKTIAVRGEGQKVSILRFTSPTNGLVYSGGLGQTLTVTGLSFRSTSAGGGTAIRATWPAVASVCDAGCVTGVLSNFEVSGEGETGNYWVNGVVLTNATAAKISTFVIRGASHTLGVAGIELRGFSTPAYIRDGDIWQVPRGVRILDTSEGAHVSDLEIVGTEYGIEVSSQAQPGNIGLPGTAITNNHTNTFVRGIYLVNHGQVTISGNLIFKLGTQNWMGIHVVHSQWNRILANYIVPIDTGAHPSNGIVLEGNSINNVIQGNTTQYMDTGIWLVHSGANDNIVTGNLNRLFRVAGILNWGAGNYLADNW
jgi:hypothetical protein